MECPKTLEAWNEGFKIENALVQFLQDNHINASIKCVRVDPSEDFEGIYVGVDSFVRDEMSLDVCGNVVTVWHYRQHEISKHDIMHPESFEQILKAFKSNLGAGPNDV
jgi:hypothetical protein